MPAIPEWLVRGANAFAVHSLFYTMNMFDLMRHAPSERFEQVEVLRDVYYGAASGEFAQRACQRLDIWRPVRSADAGPLPVMLFVHGGGFRTMSKRTHWFFARAFARMGFVVMTIDYRMGPNHLFPEPLIDVCQALEWLVAHAAEYGGDLERLVFAGESAGANLLLALTALCTRGKQDGLPERLPAWATRARDLGVSPRAILPMCGIFQVSDPERHRRRGVPSIVMGPLRDAQRSYLGEREDNAGPVKSGDALSLLADPLCLFEARHASHGGRRDARMTRLHERPASLPAMMLNVGGLDPLVDDSRRLTRVWDRGRVELREYARSGHSFMAFMWTANAQRCWSDIASFLERQQLLPRQRDAILAAG